MEKERALASDAQAAAEAFLQALARRGLEGAVLEGLRADLASRLSAACARFPEIGLRAEEFAAFLETRLAQGATPAALEALNLAELLLAWGCAVGDPKAIGLFERDLLPAVVAAVRSLRSDAALVEEVCQLVRVKLLVGPRPRIAEYAGRGSLEGWVRTAALRTALDLLRAEAPNAPSDGGDLFEGIAAPDLGPELQLLKARYRAELKSAFEQALATLEARDRTLLRLSVIEGLGIEEIGKLYGTHRSTASRWLTRARERVFDETRRALGERVGLPGHEVDSLVGLVRSQLDVSIGRLLE